MHMKFLSLDWTCMDENHRNKARDQNWTHKSWKPEATESTLAEVINFE